MEIVRWTYRPAAEERETGMEVCSLRSWFVVKTCTFHAIMERGRGICLSQMLKKHAQKSKIREARCRHALPVGKEWRLVMLTLHTTFSYDMIVTSVQT